MENHRKFGRYGPLIGAIDEGTSSVRFLVFAAQTAEMLTYHQIQIPSNCIQEGWVDQDPLLIMSAIVECIDKTIQNLNRLEIDPADMVSIGVSNQRETTVVWDSQTGLPLYNAIVWLDMRTSETVDQLLLRVRNNNSEYFKPICGLPISTYFSAVKLRWLFDNIPAVQRAVKEGRCLFGTIDTWIIWNLTGGADGGVHITEVTNASRTMLMNIKTLQWDNDLLRFFDIPPEILPKICSSSEIYGYITEGPLSGLPISGCLGDQQAALVGQMCFKKGQAKCTFGTGCFLLYNTGQAVVHSKHGLLTTVAYKLGRDKPTVYALEGSVAIAGAALNWLRDNLGIIDHFDEMKALVYDTGRIADIVFVPAFSGLYAPYWRKDARSVICGLSGDTTSDQLVRAALEAACFQTRDILDAMNADCNSNISQLLVDGGMTTNSLMMQLQADLSGIPVIRPLMTEATSLGAALAAGMAEGIGVWNIENILPVPSDTFYPRMSENERDIYHQKWKKGIDRSLGWEVDPTEESPEEILKKVRAGGDAPVTPVYPTRTSFSRPLRPRKVDRSRAILSSIPLGIFMMSVASLLVIARARSS